MKLRHRRPVLRHDHRGFSLVEVLIALTILGIIVGPLLQSFVTSAATTNRSRKLGEATLAAQNAVEAIEAASLSELLQRPHGVLDAASGSHYEVDGDGNYQLRSGGVPGLGLPTYHIGVTGLQAGDSEFSAMISLTAADYAAVNAEELTRYSAMDAIFSQSRTAEDDPDQLLYAQFLSDVNEVSNGTHTLNQIERSIELDVGWADGETDVIEATLTYFYLFRFTYQQPVFNEFGVQTGTTAVNGTLDYSRAYLLFPQGYTVVGGVLPNLYLLYYPWYGTYEGVPASADKITIRNSDDIPFTAFVVKQRDPAYDGNDSGLRAAEDSYVATVYLAQSSTADEEDFATVYSNAGQHLVSEITLPSVRYRIRLGPYLQLNRSFSGLLVEQSARNRLYAVTVELYPARGNYNDDEPLYTLQTTKLH